MTDAEWAALIAKAASGQPLTPGEQAHLLEELARRMSEGSRRAFGRDFSRWRWFWRWLMRGLFRPIAAPPVWLAVVLWILALIAWGFAIWELTRPLKEGTPPGPVCGGNGEDRITRVADVTVWGARRSYNAAVTEAEAQAAVLKARGVCTTNTCEVGKTCEPRVHIINTEQYGVWVWEPVPYQTRTVMEYNCQCTCV